MLLAVVLSGFLAVPVFYRLAGSRFASAVALLPLTLFAVLLSAAPDVLAGSDIATGVIVESYRWLPSLGVDLTFRLDGLSLLFALLITGIGSGVFLYAATYLADHPGRSRFFVSLTLFMASMLGAVLADNLLVMLVFWELTSLTSFLLMGFSHEQAGARRSAQQGLLVTVIGGLALTAAVLMLGQITGSYSLDQLLAGRDRIATHPLAGAVLALVALAAFTKSAQTPFHFWLPNAMVAPTPVSAYLHSATMVKLGVYLLARFDAVFTDHAWWTPLLTGVGMATMITSSLLLFRETDIKRVLAYSTLTALGTLVLLVGLPGVAATTAMMVFLVVHALYKAALFLVAGAIDHACGTRDLRQLSGLRRQMPITAASALLAGLSMAGLPPLLGFIGKESMYEAGLSAAMSWLVLTCLVFANAVAVVAAGLIAGRCFFGAPCSAASHAHDPPLAMAIGPLVLAVLGLLFGLAVGHIEPLLQQAVSVIAAEPQTLHLHLWHGWGTPLLLSGVTLALGAILWLGWSRLGPRLASFSAIDRYGLDATYDRLLAGLAWLATWQTDRLQSGSLASYTRQTILAFVVALLAGIIYAATSGIDGGASLAMPSGWGAPSPVTVLAVLLIIGSVAVARARSFLAGITAAGIVGFVMALVFLFQGAPDLAFTQFSVEALAVVVILLIVGRMPMHRVDTRSPRQQRIDLAVAAAFGTLATLLLLAIVATPFDSQLSDFYEQASYPQAHGRNIVNVIIVDFRGLDTLGEITVLSLAAIAALTLARRTQS